MTDRRRALHVSPTQIERWRLCPRRTAYQLAGCEPVRSDLPSASTLGDVLHGYLETYLKTGALPTATDQNLFTYYRGEEVLSAVPADIFLSGVPLFPAPGAVQSETRLEWQGYAGRADWSDPERGILGDLKTVRRLEYGLTAERGSVNNWGQPNYLGTNTQFVLQAWIMLQLYPALDSVTGQWVYLEVTPYKGGHRTRSVVVTESRESIERAMLPIHSDEARIRKVHVHGISGDALPPTVSACEAYRTPCEFQPYCNLTPEKVWEYLHKEPQMIQLELDNLLSAIEDMDIPPPPPPPPEYRPTRDVPPPPPPPDAVTVQLHLPMFSIPPIGPDPVNSPEAPPDTLRPPPLAPSDDADAVLVPDTGLTGMSKDELRKLAIERGLCDSRYRGKRDALLTLLGAPPVPPAMMGPEKYTEDTVVMKLDEIRALILQLLGTR